MVVVAGCWFDLGEETLQHPPCEAGMNVIRCNMSHGDHEEQSMKLANLEKV